MKLKTYKLQYQLLYRIKVCGLLQTSVTISLKLYITRIIQY